MTVMEEVLNARPLSDFSYEDLEKHKNTLTQALENAQLKLKGSGFVHGDLREPNILFNSQTGQVLLIDFELSGREGEVVYPLDMNIEAGWSDKVQRRLIEMKKQKIPVLISAEYDDNNLEEIINRIKNL